MIRVNVKNYVLNRIVDCNGTISYTDSLPRIGYIF